MRIQVWLIFLVEAVCGMRRGPHHPHGQNPVDQQHHHYQPRFTDSLTHDAQLLHDTKHIEEDSQILSPEQISKMTPEELEFHYFQAHDFDHNNKLDGLELLKAVYHTSEHEHDSKQANSIESEFHNFNDYIALVDKTLLLDDTDNDGFISYMEYRVARKNDPTRRTSRVLAED